MDDKVFLTKKQKNKLKTLISVIVFYMFFAYTMLGNKGGLKKGKAMNRAAFIYFVGPVAGLSWGKEMRKRKKTFGIRK